MAAENPRVVPNEQSKIDGWAALPWYPKKWVTGANDPEYSFLAFLSFNSSYTKWAISFSVSIWERFTSPEISCSLMS